LAFISFSLLKRPETIERNKKWKTRIIAQRAKTKIVALGEIYPTIIALDCFTKKAEPCLEATSMQDFRYQSRDIKRDFFAFCLLKGK